MVKTDQMCNSLKVTEGTNDEEILVTRHSQFQTPINIVNVYGEQECRTSKEKLEENWESVLTILNEIDRKGECAILLGDLNKHIEREITKNPNDKITFGGRLLLELLDTDRYKLINGTEVEQGGPYTRYDPSSPNDDEKKSILDLFIVSKNLCKYIDNLYIDKDLKFTPANPTNKRLIFTDHYSCLLTLKTFH